ncbi:hypothetical protein JHK87_027146 [Glycine soja]|nr:hypothetical protein JHK87_027146 [Glycine soja]
MNLTRFSYCLLSHQFDESPENSDLVMEATNSGEGKKTNGVSYTAFLKNPSTKKPAFGAYYYITLRKIVVGEKRVRVPRRMLEPDVNGDGGFIVDSGSTLTFMERPIFDLVAEEFVKQVNYTRARDLKFGTPPQTFPFVLDTGSSLVWLPCYSHYLCSKCNSFSNNNTPKFIPKDSFSSKFVGCRNPKCAWVFGSDVTSHCCKLAKAAFSNNNNCSQTCPAYTVQYGLGSTAGFLLSENLNFPAKNVSDFLVGCSVVSVYQPGGIAGFGRGEESLPAQMNLTRFSYCLLSHQFDESPENSDLVMEATNSGEGKKTNGVSYTAFLKNPSTKKPAFGAYYYITLRKIVVGEKRVRVPRRMLEPDVNGDGGFIVDSGSTLTFMERPIFDLVAEEFVKQVNYTRARELEKQFGLSPCFVLAGGAETASFPEMRFEFRGGAKMRLPVANYFSLVGKGDVACLTIVSDDVAGQGGAVGPAVILGNYQQQNFYVECDLENERFGFRSQSCQKRVY